MFPQNYLRTLILPVLLTIFIPNGHFKNIHASPSGMAKITDLDHDGIDDNVENALLERFRPYYKFSKQHGNDDDNRPADVLWYIQRSELLTSGDENKSPVIGNDEFVRSTAALIFRTGNSDWYKKYGPSDVTAHGVRSEYRVNPLSKVSWLPGQDNPGRRGAEWTEVTSQRNIGLYGHVVPINLVHVNDYDCHNPNQVNGSGELFYKIEYWQFFGFNDDDIGTAGRHEADLITMQLLYSPARDRVEEVLYYEHGKLEIKFNLTEGKGPFDKEIPGATEKFVEFRGKNYGKYGDIVSLKDNYSNNAVIFCQDPVTGQFTHPVAYIEWGSHEPWPTTSGFYPAVPNHDGNSYSFLTATPPNVGEVDFPSTVPGAYEFLRFNGHWGALGDGPPGPALHFEWTWSKGSLQYRPEERALTN